MDQLDQNRLRPPAVIRAAIGEGCASGTSDGQFHRIIKSFKPNYRAKYIQRAIDNYDANVTQSKISDIDQLEA